MNLRNWILAGLALAILTIGFTFGTGLLAFPRILTWMGIVMLWYGYATLRRTQPETTEDALVLQLGLNWGLAIACTFAALALTIFASSEYFVFAVLGCLLLPFAAGSNKDGKGPHRFARRFLEWHDRQFAGLLCDCRCGISAGMAVGKGSLCLPGRP